MVTVEDGLLRVRGLDQAELIVDGGALHLVAGPNRIELAGGELLVTGEVTGEITVSADSRIVTHHYHFLDPQLTGRLVGAGSLTLTSETLNQEWGHSLVVAGASPDFTGAVTVDSLLVNVRDELALGTGSIEVLPGGRLHLAPLGFPRSLVMANEVHLNGGEFRGFGGSGDASRLSGDLSVTGRSIVAEVDLLGSVYLRDGATLTTYGEFATQFLGPINVGGQVAVEYGLTPVDRDEEHPLQIYGTISSAAATSVLNLVDYGLSEILLDASYHASAGQSLQILKDGQPLALRLATPGKAISGEGTILNAVEVADGAAIAPGASLGVLHLADIATLSGGGIYDWEMNVHDGVAGEGWDLLQVDGEMTFAGTPEDPWVLRISDISAAAFESGGTWLIANAGEIAGFDPGSARIDVGPLTARYPSLASSPFSLDADAGALSLSLQVVSGDFDLNGQVDGADLLAWQRGESPNPQSVS
ncbi:MAG: hypothetical protein AAF961_10265, partial [Planctomycetota bacterium]